MKTNNPFRAMVITLITALSLSCMAVFVKLLAHQVEISQVILFRFGSGLIYILGLALWTRLRDRKISFPPRAPFKFHFARAFFGVVSMFFFYSTFKFMPLVDSTLLMMTAPLFLPIFSWIIWRERTSWQVVLAIIFGFIGLVFILRPDSAVFHQGALWGLGGGAFAALAILSLKRATLDDPPMTILLCYFPLAVLMSGLVCLFSWMPLTWHLVLLLLGVGFFGTIYQEGLVRACQ